MDSNGPEVGHELNALQFLVLIFAAIADRRSPDARRVYRELAIFGQLAFQAHAQGPIRALDLDDGRGS